MLEETKTEITETPKTEAENKEEFGEKMDEILKDTAPAGEKDTVPAGTKDEDEVPEVVSEEVGEVEEPAVAGEATEALKGVDPEVLEVCRDWGWDDKKIAWHAKEAPKLLEEIREELDKAETEEAPAGARKPETKVEKEFEELKFTLDPAIVGQEVVDAFGQVAGRLNEYGKGLTEEQGRLQSERKAAFTVRVDNCFDRFTKDYPDLGNAVSLDKKQFKLRQEIFVHAQIDADMKKIPLEKAIESQVRRYKNQEGEKVAGQKLLDSLAKQKKRFTNAPTRRHSDVGTRKFKDENEEKEALMSEAYKEAGIEE
ncbi:MAG: hypothetical protein MUP81_03120 [Dehalococcoidia bacterium]|nr:hypothetical protein [Dehalococcoidia bacterium]